MAAQSVARRQPSRNRRNRRRRRPTPPVSLSVAATLGVLLLAECGGGAGTDDAGQSGELAGDTPTRLSRTGSAAPATPLRATEGAPPRAPLQRGEELIRVVTANIDLDGADEQVLIFRDGPSTELPIRLGVVDYDSVRRTYFRTWEGQTGATNARTIELSLVDVVGDHALELVARGINGRGDQTIDIFRKTPSPAQIGLNFSMILSVEVAGVIELEAAERPSSYVVGRRNGPSFPVVTYTSDPQANNITDLIKTSYFWEYSAGRYVGTEPQRIPGEQVEDTQLRELYASREPDGFEALIAGPWYRMLQARPGTPLDLRMEVIHFDVAKRRVSLFSGDVQEIYIWNISRRTLCCSLQIRVHNESIPSIEKKITVTARSLRELHVAIQGVERSDRIEAGYQKLDDDLQAQLVDVAGHQAAPAELQLGGLYRDAGGDTILFEAPSFTWSGPDQSESGGYAIHDIGEQVLVLRVLSRSGLTLAHRSFILQYDEQLSGERLVRSILLQPARLTVDGPVARTDPARRFEQVEFISDGDDASAATANVVVVPGDAEQDSAEAPAASGDSP